MQDKSCIADKKYFGIIKERVKDFIKEIKYIQ